MRQAAWLLGSRSSGVNTDPPNGPSPLSQEKNGKKIGSRMRLTMVETTMSGRPALT